AVGHVLLDDPGIAVAEHHRPAGVAHELGRALDHAVPLALRCDLHLAAGRHLEALLGAALGLQLRHCVLVSRQAALAEIPCPGARSAPGDTPHTTPTPADAEAAPTYFASHKANPALAQGHLRGEFSAAPAP